MKRSYYSKSLFFLSLLILFSGKIFSQLNQWVWINGHNIINQPGIYGTPGIPSLANKPGARGEAVSWKDKSGNFWLFGGYGYGSGTSQGPLNDLWKYNPSTNEWTWKKGAQLPLANSVYGTKGIASANNVPGSRQMSAKWTDDGGNLWLFGGSGSSFFNDLWKYDIATNQWTWISGDNSGNVHGQYGIQGQPSLTNKPGSRTNAVCWKDNTGNLWLFGGNGYGASGIGGRLGDLWKYNISSNSWTWMKGDSVIQSLSVYGNKNISSLTNKPGSRTGSSGWTDKAGNLWLFGGIGYASVFGVLNDLWKYNVSANEWVWENGDSTVGRPAVYYSNSLLPVAAKPGALHNAVNWSDASGNLWLFGGRGYTATAFGELNSLWKYNVSANQWSFVKGDALTYVAGEYGVLGVPAETNKPGSRETPVAWTDSLGNLWMFGGESYPLNTTTTSFQNDLWKFSIVNILPVKLLSFSGKLQDKNILLNWIVENEIDLDHYEIEKSLNGSNFNKIGIVKTANKRTYDFQDVEQNQAGTIYYRLKMVDIDGKFSYSNIISFHGETAGLILYPNPASTYTQLKFNKNIHGEMHVEMIDVNARIIAMKTYYVNGNSLIIPTDGMPSGTYTIIIDCSEERWVRKITIVK